MQSRNAFGWLMILLSSFIAGDVAAQTGKAAPKPLYGDPIYNGAADPVVIWNKKEKEWWMFYTARRATIDDTTGVKWVHGTRIGIAESKDGRIWKYKDTANINYHPDGGYTFWA